ncbi:MAG: hypothetical protein M3N98_14920 [Actinomycetota bacterium]|nr:hypothetical protein [Actinomycetota bacterium]
MSHIVKFLMDDHNRIRRSFSNYRRTPWDLDEGLNVCELLWVHLTLEQELVHPAIWDKLDKDMAQTAEAEEALIHGLMTQIDKLDPQAPVLARLMELLERAVARHIHTFERGILPALSAAVEDPFAMGSEAFRRWQELFNERQPRTWEPMKKLANTGWGGGGRLANSGW